jgi:hypothetical protein
LCRLLAIAYTQKDMPSERSESLGNLPDASGDGSQGERRSKKSLLGEPELRTIVQDQLQTLALELRQGKSERLQQYLDFGSRFHRYSRANQWLIYDQMPSATRVASYRKWQEEGYQVAKGERGVRILAPSIRRLKPPDAQTQEEQGSDEEPPKRIVRFVAVSVFDQSQLTPDKTPPEFFTPVAGDADQLYQRLEEAATQDGFRVEQSDDTHGAEGFSQGRRLVTRSNLASVNRTLTMTHEYAHGLLHQGIHLLGLHLSERRNLVEISRSLKECHAEATAYVVAKHFGLPNPFSADYLLQWGTTPDILRAELDIVLAAASHIIGKLDGAPSELYEPSP